MPVGQLDELGGSFTTNSASLWNRRIHAGVNSLGIVKMRLAGKMLGTFLPYTGWALIILSAAYAVAVIWNSVK